MKYIAIDIESIGVSLKQGLVWVIAVNDGTKCYEFESCFGLKRKDIPAIFIKQMEDPKICKVIHNASFDGAYLERWLGIKVRNLWCTMLADYCINGYSPPPKKRRKDGTTTYSPAELALQEDYGTALKFVLPRYGFPSPNKDITKNFIDRPKGIAWTREEKEYWRGDIKYLLKLQRAQEFVLRRDKQLEVALLEFKTVEKIISMRIRGVNINQKLWKDIAKKNEKEYNRRIAKLPKAVENWGSEKQVKAFFRTKGVDIPSYKYLDEILYETRNPILKDFMSAQEIRKNVTTYGMNWFTDGFIHEDGMLRPEIYQDKDTGRMSYKTPNLQQLKKEGEHRSAIIPHKGRIFDIGDFSGQELGIMAAMSEEKLWIDAMLRGDDVHGLTASLLYERDWDQGYKRGCSFPKKCNCPEHQHLRENAKTLNFMLAYGGGPKKFGEKTGLSFNESKLVIKRYKKIIPNITKCLDDNATSAIQNGECYSADPYQRRRLLLADEEWHIANQGKNSPIQAAGANMLKLSMISMPESIPIALVVHDEIVVEPLIRDGVKAAKVLKQVMEKSADFITGIKGLIKVHPRLSYSLSKPKH